MAPPKSSLNSQKISDTLSPWRRIPMIRVRMASRRNRAQYHADILKGETNYYHNDVLVQFNDNHINYDASRWPWLWPELLFLRGRGTLWRRRCLSKGCSTSLSCWGVILWRWFDWMTMIKVMILWIKMLMMTGNERLSWSYEIKMCKLLIF